MSVKNRNNNKFYKPKSKKKKKRLQHNFKQTFNGFFKFYLRSENYDFNFKTKT